MQEWDFEDMCNEICREISAERTLDILSPTPRNTPFTETLGLYIKRPEFGHGIISANMFYADENGLYYTSSPIPPRSGFRTYDESDLRAYKQAFEEAIEELQERIRLGETDQELMKNTPRI